MQNIKRAQDLVSEAEMWHLVCDVADKYSPSNAPHSSLSDAAHLADAHCSPIDDSTLLTVAMQQTRAFRKAANFPCFTSLHEMAALRMIGTAFAHAMPADRVKIATKATAAAFTKLYKKQLDSRTKRALHAQLQKPLNDEDLAAVGAFFRHTYNENPKRAETWDSTALKHADAWQKAFRSERADAEAWSVYLHAMASCGAVERDPTFIERVARRVGGIGGGNHAAVDTLITDVERLSAERTEQDVVRATRSTLRQASNVHELSTNENINEI